MNLAKFLTINRLLKMKPDRVTHPSGQKSPAVCIYLEVTAVVFLIMSVDCLMSLLPRECLKIECSHRGHSTSHLEIV